MFHTVFRVRYKTWCGVEKLISISNVMNAMQFYPLALFRIGTDVINPLLTLVFLFMFHAYWPFITYLSKFVDVFGFCINVIRTNCALLKLIEVTDSPLSDPDFS